MNNSLIIKQYNAKFVFKKDNYNMINKTDEEE